MRIGTLQRTHPIKAEHLRVVLSPDLTSMLFFLVTFAYAGLAAAATQSAAIHHDIELRLDPSGGTLEVRDRISFAEPFSSSRRELVFTLNAGLVPAVEDPGARLSRTQADFESDRVNAYALKLSTGNDAVTLRYRGRLAQWPGTDAEAPGNAGDQVGRDGVLLTGASHWYPRFRGELISFSLRVRLPEGWTAVSQGERLGARGEDGQGSDWWQEIQPQEDIVVAANRFETFIRAGAIADAMVFLRQPDEATAEQYLQATMDYVRLYDELIGPYPYSKFALVENFWESGYGMPSFTLLGPRVLRLPFIIHSSYPHEILHNWWGNGVYVDYASGNWSEGLTAYLADHLIREQRGQGAEFRRSALEKYRNYVDGARDFSLDRFRSKHGEASEAVGYNKTLMFFHMLRRGLGDRVFLEALRHFYSTHRFRTAGYADLRRSFEAISGRDLKPEFDQWIHRVGAPALAVEGILVENVADGYRLRGRIRQTQDAPHYRLLVPIAVESGGTGEIQWRDIPMDGRAVELDVPVAEKPTRVWVDPAFDLFRRLELAESPPLLSELFGSDEVRFVVSAKESGNRSYIRLATALGATIVSRDTDILHLPENEPIWLFGWENTHRDALTRALAGQDVSIDGHMVRIGSETAVRDSECIVLTARRLSTTGPPIGWIGCDRLQTIGALARKLPHYGRYSFLSFVGDDALNTLKGRWRVTNSPLMVRLDPLAPDEPLLVEARPSLVEAVTSK